MVNTFSVGSVKLRDMFRRCGFIPNAGRPTKINFVKIKEI